MPFVTTHPEAMAAAAGPATSGVPSAADEVAAITAAHFVANAQMYQAAGVKAHATRQAFVSTLWTGAESYAGTEIANATITQ